MTKGPIDIKVTIRVADKKHPINYQQKIEQELIDSLSFETVKERLVKAFAAKLEEAFKGTPPKLLIVRNKDV